MEQKTKARKATDVKELQPIVDLKLKAAIDAEFVSEPTDVHFTAHNLIDTAITEEVERLQCSTGTSKLEVGIYAVSNTAQVPEFATAGSACFDLRADYTNYEVIKVFNNFNEVIMRSVVNNPELSGKQSIKLNPKERALIPTNLIFDIPSGYSLKIYPRSGISLKEGLNLVNCVGVVDHDYIEPVFITLFNNSDVPAFIGDQDRLCQGEFTRSPQNSFVVLTQKPDQKTNRIGGFGSTNKN
jgi:dUTP pyrophosphatase